MPKLLWLEDFALGTMHRLTCSNCGTWEAYSSGIGNHSHRIWEALYNGDLKMLRHVTSAKTYKQVVDLIKGETGKIRFVQNQSNFCCTSCNTASHLHQVQVIGLSIGNWTEVLSCENCSAILAPTKRELNEFNCKECGQPALIDEHAGEWDWIDEKSTKTFIIIRRLTAWFQEARKNLFVKFIVYSSRNRERTSWINGLNSNG